MAENVYLRNELPYLRTRRYPLTLPGDLARARSAEAKLPEHQRWADLPAAGPQGSREHPYRGSMLGVGYRGAHSGLKITGCSFRLVYREEGPSDRTRGRWVLSGRGKCAKIVQDTGHQVWQMPTESVTQRQVHEELQNSEPNRWSDVLDFIGLLLGITGRAVRVKRPGIASDRPVADYPRRVHRLP